MDPSLLLARQKFQKRNLASISSLSDASTKHQEAERAKALRTSSSNNAARIQNVQSQASTNATSALSLVSSQYKFAILTKIVRHLRDRFFSGYKDALTLEEILDETKQLEISKSQQIWLEDEALRNNLRIEVVDGDKYIYKQKYAISDKKSLLKLLQQYDEQGLGGILLEEVEESCPNIHKILAQLEENVSIVTRPGDKRKVLFYRDASLSKVVLEPEFIQLWRNIMVDSLDDNQIEDYLSKKGLSCLQIDASSNQMTSKKRKQMRRKNSNDALSMKYNNHLSNLLQDYSIKKDGNNLQK